MSGCRCLGERSAVSGIGYVDNTPRRGPHSPAAARRARGGAVLELVEEIADQEVDVEALHDALAVLLARYHRALNASGAIAE